MTFKAFGASSRRCACSSWAALFDAAFNRWLGSHRCCWYYVAALCAPLRNPTYVQPFLVLALWICMLNWYGVDHRHIFFEPPPLRRSPRLHIGIARSQLWIWRAPEVNRDRFLSIVSCHTVQPSECKKYTVKRKTIHPPQRLPEFLWRPPPLLLKCTTHLLALLCCARLPLQLYILSQPACPLLVSFLSIFDACKDTVVLPSLFPKLPLPSSMTSHSTRDILTTLVRLVQKAFLYKHVFLQDFGTGVSFSWRSWSPSSISPFDLDRSPLLPSPEMIGVAPHCYRHQN